MPICLKYHPQTTLQVRVFQILYPILPKTSFFGGKSFLKTLWLWFVWQLHDTSSFAACLWQWATSNGQGFLKRWGDEIFCRHATNLTSPSNYSICKIARLANLQLFQGLHSHERRPLKMSKWQAWLQRKDLCLPILVETDLRQIFSRDRSEKDFGHSALLRGQISLLRSTSGWGPSPFTTIAFKPCVWAVTFWNTSPSVHSTSSVILAVPGILWIFLVTFA